MKNALDLHTIFIHGVNYFEAQVAHGTFSVKENVFSIQHFSSKLVWYFDHVHDFPKACCGIWL